MVIIRRICRQVVLILLLRQQDTVPGDVGLRGRLDRLRQHVGESRPAGATDLAHHLLNSSQLLSLSVRALNRSLNRCQADLLTGNDLTSLQDGREGFRGGEDRLLHPLFLHRDIARHSACRRGELIGPGGEQIVSDRLWHLRASIDRVLEIAVRSDHEDLDELTLEVLNLPGRYDLGGGVLLLHSIGEG